MLPVLRVGSLAIQTPGLVLLAGLWLGLSLAERHAADSGVKANDLYNLAFITLVAGVVGARLAYILRYPSIFADSPASIFSLNPGLLDLWGAAAAGLIAGLVYGQRRQMQLWPTLDALAPALAVLAVTLAVSHLASGAGYGNPTNLPWGIEQWGARRHPTQVYEVLAALFILWAVWPGQAVLHLRGSANPAPGVRFLSFLALTAAASLFVDAFHGGSLLLPGGWRATQVVSWVVLAASLWMLGKKLKDGARQFADSRDIGYDP
jgi:phosphatidylglycerol:prolipoprotein diacylglycerol transferase